MYGNLWQAVVTGGSEVDAAVCISPHTTVTRSSCVQAYLPMHSRCQTRQVGCHQKKLINILHIWKIFMNKFI